MKPMLERVWKFCELILASLIVAKLLGVQRFIGSGKGIKIEFSGLNKIFIPKPGS